MHSTLFSEICWRSCLHIIPKTNPPLCFRWVNSAGNLVRITIFFMLCYALILLSDISYLRSDRSGNMVFNPTGSPSFTFETPILQISSAVGPSKWIATPSSVLLIRTHTSSSLLRLERSKVTRELDITRSETGGIPIVDSRILASGPDIVVVNRSGKVYKCTAYQGSKAMYVLTTILSRCLTTCLD